MSERPCITLAPDGWVQVSRQEWDELQSELHHLRSLVGGSGQMGEIIQAAARVSDVRVEDILGRGRSLRLTRIRMAIYVVARGMEIDAQSICVGLRRHRTLHLYDERQSAALICTDADLRSLISRLEAACS